MVAAIVRFSETAQRILDDKKGRVARGEVLLPRVDRVTYDEVAAELLTYFETRRRRTTEVKVRLVHLDAFFRGWKLPAITTSAVDTYIQAGAGPATINRELATLSKMLRLAHQRDKLQRLPAISRLQEPPARAGFVTRAQYDAIARHLPEDLGVGTLIGFTYGWRLREFLYLRREQLDLGAGTLRLDPGTTKNREGRIVHLTPGLRAALEAQLGRVKALECRLGRIVPQLFRTPRGTVRASSATISARSGCRPPRRRGFPASSSTICAAPRCGTWNWAGVSRAVAMKISGHKTEAVYRRYAIVSDADLAQAASRIAGGHVSRHVSAGR